VPAGYASGVAWTLYNVQVFAGGDYSLSDVTGSGTSVASGVATNFANLKSITSGFDFNSLNGASDFSLVLSGYFQAPVDGVYTFNVAVDDVAWFWIGASATPDAQTSTALINTVWQDEFGSPPETSTDRGGFGGKSASLPLAGGQMFPVELLMSQGGGPFSLTISYTLPDGTTSSLASSYFIYSLAPSPATTESSSTSTTVGETTSTSTSSANGGVEQIPHQHEFTFKGNAAKENWELVATEGGPFLEDTKSAKSYPPSAIGGGSSSTSTSTRYETTSTTSTTADGAIDYISHPHEFRYKGGKEVSTEGGPFIPKRPPPALPVVIKGLPAGDFSGLLWSLYNAMTPLAEWGPSSLYSSSPAPFSLSSVTSSGAPVATGVATNFANLNAMTDNFDFSSLSGGNDFSMVFNGFFQAPVTGSYDFSMAADDGAWLWIGASATPDAQSTAALIAGTNYFDESDETSAEHGGKGGTSASISLTGGQTYPVIILFTQYGGGYDLSFTYTIPGGSPSSLAGSYFFYSQPAPPPPVPESPSAPKTITDHLVAWYDVGSYDSNSGTWSSKVSGSSASFSGAGTSLAQDSVGNGAGTAVQYLSGSTSSFVSFPEDYSQDSAFSICTVSRYTDVYQQGRIFQSTGTNWLHGHWGGGSYTRGDGMAGVAYFGNWVADPNTYPVHPNTNWVSMCSSIGADGSAIVFVNGVLLADAPSGFSLPQQLVINAPSAAWAMETSDFGVAELLTWDVALSQAALTDAAFFLGAKYSIGFYAALPPAPAGSSSSSSSSTSSSTEQESTEGGGGPAITGTYSTTGGGYTYTLTSDANGCYQIEQVGTAEVGTYCSPITAAGQYTFSNGQCGCPGGTGYQGTGCRYATLTVTCGQTTSYTESEADTCDYPATLTTPAVCQQQTTTATKHVNTHANLRGAGH